MFEVTIKPEQSRGCGRRHSGKDGVGKYLVGRGEFMPCGRLPFPLVDADGNPQKHFLGYKEINPQILFSPDKEPTVGGCVEDCWRCPMANLESVGDYAILIFVGAEHYPTPDSFMQEARQMGISRRVSSLPSKFEFGKHRVYLAHIRGIWGTDPVTLKHKQLPAVISCYKPHLELVIDDPDNVPEKAKELKEKYGDNASIVKVIPC